MPALDLRVLVLERLLNGGGAYQPSDATLTALASLAGTPDTFAYFDGPDHMSLTGLMPYSRSLLLQPNAGSWRSTLGLGTLAIQNAGAVAISGGTATLADLEVDSPTLSVDVVNHRVGIGTTSPGSKLHVIGGSVTLDAPVSGLLSISVNADSDSPAIYTNRNAGGGRYAVNCGGNAPSYFGGPVQVVGRIDANVGISPLIPAGNNQNAIYSNATASGGTNRWFILHQGDAPSYFGGTVQVAGTIGLHRAPVVSELLSAVINAGAFETGISLQMSPDQAGTWALNFKNAAGTQVGTISLFTSSTSYNTTSDVRLKHNIQPLTNVLECIRALRPISHLWNADGSYGEGFLAHELMQQVPLAVTGEPDAVDAQGHIIPQQVDHSKLVPRLTAGLQAALAQIDALTARVEALEAGGGP